MDTNPGRGEQVIDHYLPGAVTNYERKKYRKKKRKLHENLIEEFCETNYGIKFQLFEKSDVRGKNSNQVYRWLSSIEENGWNDKSPRWNFFKYLVDENGSLKAVYSSNVNPLDKEIIDFVLN